MGRRERERDSDHRRYAHQDHHHGKTTRRWHNSPDDREDLERNRHDHRSGSRRERDHKRSSRKNERDRERRDDRRKRYRSTSRSRSRSPSSSSQSSDSSLRGWGSEDDRDVEPNRRPANKKQKVRVEEASRSVQHPSARRSMTPIRMTPNFFNPDDRRSGPRLGVQHTLKDRRAPLERIPMGNHMEDMPGPSSAPPPPPYSEVDETQPKSEVELTEEERREKQQREAKIAHERMALQVLHHITAHGFSPKLQMALHVLWSLEGTDTNTDCIEVGRYHGWNPATAGYLKSASLRYFKGRLEGYDFSRGDQLRATEEFVQTYTRESLNNVVHCIRDSGCTARLHEANQYLAQGNYARALEVVTGWPIVTPKDEMDESDDYDDNDPRGGSGGGPTHRHPSRREYRGDAPSDTDHDQGGGHGKNRTAPYRETRPRGLGVDHSRCYRNQDHFHSGHQRSQEADQENPVTGTDNDFLEARIAALPSIYETVEDIISNSSLSVTMSNNRNPGRRSVRAGSQEVSTRRDSNARPTPTKKISQSASFASSFSSLLRLQSKRKNKPNHMQLLAKSKPARVLWPGQIPKEYKQKEKYGPMEADFVVDRVFNARTQFYVDENTPPVYVEDGELDVVDRSAQRKKVITGVINHGHVWKRRDYKRRPDTTTNYRAWYRAFRDLLATDLNNAALGRELGVSITFESCQKQRWSELFDQMSLEIVSMSRVLIVCEDKSLPSSRNL